MEEAKQVDLSITVRTEDAKDSVTLAELFKDGVVNDYAQYKSEIEKAGGKQVLVSDEDGSGRISFSLFREITDYKGLIFIDKDYAVYNALGCKAKGDSVFKSLSSSVFGKSSKFIKTSNLEGNLDQQGGEFVVTSDGSVVYRFIDSHAGEYKDYEGLLSALKKIGQ